MTQFDWSNRGRGRGGVDDDNGRVTLAVLKQTVIDGHVKLDHLSDRLDRVIQVSEDRLRQLESAQVRLGVKVEHLEDGLEIQGKRSNLIDAMTATVAGIAALLGLTR